MDPQLQVWYLERVAVALERLADVAERNEARDAA